MTLQVETNRPLANSYTIPPSQVALFAPQKPSFMIFVMVQKSK